MNLNLNYVTSIFIKGNNYEELTHCGETSLSSIVHFKIILVSSKRILKFVVIYWNFNGVIENNPLLQNTRKKIELKITHKL